jgi:hypothetical protein
VSLRARTHTYIHQRQAHPRQADSITRVRGVGGAGVVLAGWLGIYAPRTLLYEYLSQFSRTKLHALSAAFTGANFLQAAASSSFLTYSVLRFRGRDAQRQTF